MVFGVIHCIKHCAGLSSASSVGRGGRRIPHPSNSPFVNCTLNELGRVGLSSVILEIWRRGLFE